MSSGRFGHRSWALNIWSRPKIAGTVVSLLIGLASGHLASAHEVGRSPSKIQEQIVPERPVPRSPRVVSNDDMRRLLKSADVPKDVLVVRCTLAKFASCRGLDIELFTSDMKKILTTNTGTSGFVGFEGLPQNTHFVVRIQSSKYHGEIQGSSASILVINVDRK